MLLASLLVGNFTIPVLCDVTGQFLTMFAPSLPYKFEHGSNSMCMFGKSRGVCDMLKIMQQNSNWFVEIDTYMRYLFFLIESIWPEKQQFANCGWQPDMCEARCCSWGKTIICWAAHCGLVGQQISLHQIDPNDCYILAGLLAVYSNNQHCCYKNQNHGSIWQELSVFLG